jgi:hypothetical protein
VDDSTVASINNVQENERQNGMHAYHLVQLTNALTFSAANIDDSGAVACDLYQEAPKSSEVSEAYPHTISPINQGAIDDFPIGTLPLQDTTEQAGSANQSVLRSGETQEIPIHAGLSTGGKNPSTILLNTD